MELRSWCVEHSLQNDSGWELVKWLTTRVGFYLRLRPESGRARRGLQCAR